MCQPASTRKLLDSVSACQDSNVSATRLLLNPLSLSFIQCKRKGTLRFEAGSDVEDNSEQGTSMQSFHPNTHLKIVKGLNYVHFQTTSNATPSKFRHRYGRHGEWTRVAVSPCPSTGKTPCRTYSTSARVCKLAPILLYALASARKMKLLAVKSSF
eukprot:6490434-Amphidinium_carterae.2